jgi:uncharacterized protein (TIGR02594 family)
MVLPIAGSPFPEKWAWLTDEPGPKALLEAMKVYGTLEKPATADNPVIIAWADEIATRFPSPYNDWAAEFYDDDGIAWCGLGHAIVHARAGRAPVNKYLSAMAWREFGHAVDRPMLGDTMVKPRYGSHGNLIGGHVTMYVGEDATKYYGLGANQSDAYNIAAWPRGDFKWFRRPNQPENVSPRRVTAGGALADGSEA